MKLFQSKMQICHLLASLTKIMTGYVVTDQIEKGFISKEDQVLISKFVGEWAQECLWEGKRVSGDDLLKGMIIQSVMMRAVL